MTKEEAKKRLEIWLKCGECPEDKRCYDSHLHSTCEYTDYCDEVSIKEAIKMAIEALKQEPCEDAISRKAVLDTLENMDRALDEDRTVENYKELLRECYKVLPPVSSPEKPKTGYWIEHEHNGIVHIECSRCSTWFLRAHLIRNSFCPNCGAKMQEVEE